MYNLALPDGSESMSRVELHGAGNSRGEAPTIYAACSRGHSNTRTDAIIQHAIMKTNPGWNEPVRWLSSPMIFGPMYPPMLAVQLMKPTAAAAAELVRNDDGSAQNDGKYATVPKPSSVNTVTSSRFECGIKNHAINASAAVS